ncbi:unnamed protein product [Peniophora sp. CBMAI 1063]|nr:unnamed protein product [Peniophora sp. CBMAI 1063]
MRAAPDQAEEAFDAHEVPVGCVFVRDGIIIARARNRTNEVTRHAELEAVDAILADPTPTAPDPTARLRPLSRTTLQAGLERCFFGAENERFGGCGSVLGVHSAVPHPKLSSLPATGGLLREEAIMALRRFYITENTNVPKSKVNRVLKTEILPPKTSLSS